MRSRIPVACAALLLAAACSQAETLISKDYTIDQVRKAAGEPIGKMNQGNKVIWLYRRGNVTFINGKVTNVGWLTEAQFAEKTRRQQEKARAAAEARAKKAEAARKAEEARKAAAAARKRNAPGESLAPPRAAGQHNYVPPFKRNPSESAKFIGEIPVEFEAILMPKKLVQEKNIQIGRFTGKSRRKALSGLQAALGKYPAELTDNTVNTIYFPSQILSGGDRVGGFADISSRKIYITNSRTFHHEYGHVLLHSFYKLFPRKDWLALNDRDYTDDGRIVRVLYEARQRYGSPYYHDKGFINRYAMVSLHEDFAETFEITMAHPDIMDKTQRNSERISKKIDLMVRFLNDIIAHISGKESVVKRENLLAGE